MKEGPQFDSQGIDATTYAPFILHNALYTEWKDVRLEFSDWGWIGSRFGESPNRYYLNGYGIEGLVKAARHSRGLEVEPADMHYNSEGNTCYIHFDSMAAAVKTAELATAMLSSKEELIAMITVARENGWEDG